MTASPRRSSGAAAESAVAERLVATASDLFYREGINAVGIQRVIDEAGVAKASLYAHFPSKDDLVAECLAKRSDTYRQWVTRELESIADPIARVLRLFDANTEWMAAPEFRGCPFANADGELASRSHPARAVVAAHVAWSRDLMLRLVTEAGLPQAEALAGALLNLLQGAVARALSEGTTTAGHDARWAAATLLDAGRRASAPALEYATRHAAARPGRAQRGRKRVTRAKR